MAADDSSDASAAVCLAVGGFPAMVGNVPFLMKDVVLLAASVYLLRQDVLRLRCSGRAPLLAAS